MSVSINLFSRPSLKLLVKLAGLSTIDVKSAINVRLHLAHSYLGTLTLTFWIS